MAPEDPHKARLAFNELVAESLTMAPDEFNQRLWKIDFQALAGSGDIVPPYICGLLQIKDGTRYRDLMRHFTYLGICEFIVKAGPKDLAYLTNVEEGWEGDA